LTEMEAPHTSLAVANKFIEMSRKDNRPITLMKLLKVIYFAHGWHLALCENKPLIDDTIEAWKFGPVAPTVYHALKENASNPIKDFGKDINIEKMELFVPILEGGTFLDAFLNRIWEIYGKFTASQLSELTHQPGTPWYKIWFDEKGCERKGAEIPDHLIYEFFKQKLSPKEPPAEKINTEADNASEI
jgi:uncharacterized phage-associated protein